MLKAHSRFTFSVEILKTIFEFTFHTDTLSVLVKSLNIENCFLDIVLKKFYIINEC